MAAHGKRPLPIVRRRPRRGGKVSVLVALLAAVCLLAWPLSGARTTGAAQTVSPPGAPPSDGEPSPDSVIVEVAPDADPLAVARDLGVSPTFVYDEAINGFAAELPPAAVAAARRSGAVARVTRDRPFRVAAETVPTGVDRVDAEPGARAVLTGLGRRIDADVAVLDTGISPHPDLSIAGGRACIGRDPEAYGDRYKHGTHVAGTIAAADDGRGVVGVAPGARLWAVKVLNDRGKGSTSSILCGLEWVLGQGSIDVVNMSLVAPGSDGQCADDPLHQAICRIVRTGVPVAAAAGNAGRDAAQTVPATWRETIAVSAFADFDGRPGGLGKPTCDVDGDDTLAGFSNVGEDVDIAAPGVCIRSTWPGGRLRSKNGTSMAAPHVAGALALFAAANPRATPDDARAWLLSDAASRPKDDPRVGLTNSDGDLAQAPERVLYLGPPPEPDSPPGDVTGGPASDGE